MKSTWALLVLLTCARATDAWSAAREKFFQGTERAAITAELAQLRAIQAQHEAAIVAQPGVLAMGIGVDKAQRALVFVVTVDEQLPVPPLPAALDGVPLRVDRGRPPQLVNGGAGCDPCHAEAQDPPVRMGNSLLIDDSGGTCTLGFMACDRGSGLPVFVTNSHCATVLNADDLRCSGSSPLGTTAFHPEFRGIDIGEVSGHAAPTCDGIARTTDATKVDAARVSAAIRDIGFPDVNPGSVLPGDPVQKSGRTTGLTTGEVDQVNYFDSVPNCCLNSFLRGQIFVVGDDDVFLRGGDSGSALLDTDDPPAIVGLLWGHSDDSNGIANDIAEVLSALDLDLNVLSCFCAAETAVAGEAAAAATLTLLRRLRDEVLTQSTRGQAYITQFDRFSGEVALLLLRYGPLRRRTERQLERVLPVFQAIVDRQPGTVRRRDVRRVDRLVQAYAARGSQELAAALEAFRPDLQDPQVLAAFGVTIVP